MPYCLDYPHPARVALLRQEAVRIRAESLTFNRSAMPFSSRLIADASKARVHPLRFSPAGDPDDEARGVPGSSRKIAEHEDLPYKVELWDVTRSQIEQVLAITANGSIGYAAYYAATREHPDRYITLRHKNRIVSRWNEAKH
jgi:hypothetical protein